VLQGDAALRGLCNSESMAERSRDIAPLFPLSRLPAHQQPHRLSLKESAFFFQKPTAPVVETDTGEIVGDEGWLAAGRGAGRLDGST